jgi:ribosomal protein L15
MALLGTFTKQPGETLDFDISYATVLAGRTDVIASQTTSVAPAGMTVSTTIRNAENNLVKVVVTGGTDNISYTVTVIATSTASPPLVYEDEVIVLVEEV